MKRWVFGALALTLALVLGWWLIRPTVPDEVPLSHATKLDAGSIRRSRPIHPARGSTLTTHSSAAPDDPYTFTELRGRVVVRSSSTAIAGASVRVFEDGRLRGEAISDAGGNFTFAGLSPGRYRFEAEARGFLVASIHLTKLDVLEDDENITIALEPAGRLSGRVFDPTGAGVEGAAVSLERRDSPNHGEPFALARTRAGGEYQFEAVPLEALVVGAHHPRFGTLDELLEAQRSRDTELDLRFSSARRLSGVVRGPNGPLVGALVWPSPPGPMKHAVSATISPYAVETDANGRYELVLRDGVSGVVAWAKGHRSQIEWPPREQVRFDFSLAPAVSLRVRVIDGPGRGQSEAQVSVEDTASGVSEAKTDVDGVVVLGDLRAGPATVRVRTTEGRDLTERISLEPGKQNELEVALGGGGRIEGHVVNAVTGDRITEMFLMLGREDASFAQRVKSPSGQFIFEGLRSGTWTLIIQSPGFVHHRLNAIEVTAGTTDLGAIELVPLARVEGRVSPAPGGRLLLGEARSRANGRDSSFVVEPDGRFVAELRGGSYDIELKDGEETVRATTHWHLRPGEVVSGLQIELREF